MPSRWTSQTLNDALRPGCGGSGASSTQRLSRWLPHWPVCREPGRRRPHCPVLPARPVPTRPAVVARPQPFIRYPAEARAFLNAPRRPSQSAEREDLLFISLRSRRYSRRRRVALASELINALDRDLSLAGFDPLSPVLVTSEDEAASSGELEDQQGQVFRRDTGRHRGMLLNPPEHAIVMRVDEKSQIQALDRTQPGLPLKKAAAGQ